MGRGPKLVHEVLKWPVRMSRYEFSISLARNRAKICFVVLQLKNYDGIIIPRIWWAVQRSQRAEDRPLTTFLSNRPSEWHFTIMESSPFAYTNARFGFAVLQLETPEYEDNF